MNTFLWISLTLFLINLPFVVVVVILSLISKLTKNVEIHYNISGFYQISNLEIRIISQKQILIFFLKHIGIELIWFRIRILIRNFLIIGSLESLEEVEMNDLIRMVLAKIRNNGIPQNKLENNDVFQNKKNKYVQKIINLIDKFKNNDKKEKDIMEIEKLEDLNKNQTKISLYEKIITQLIILFDLMIINLEVFFNLSKSKSSYNVRLEKLHVGGLKGQNKVHKIFIYFLKYIFSFIISLTITTSTVF